MTPAIETRTIRITTMECPVGIGQKPIYVHHDIRATCLKGLCVHKDLKGSRWKWMITHEASGLSIERIGATTKARAMQNMQAAIALPIDWTLGESAVLAALRASPGIRDALTRIGESN